MRGTVLNDQQNQAITHSEGPLLIVAGAGTGKTTVITRRIAHLILDKNVPAGNILALTFMEKAAAEMETRIDELLPYGYTNMWIETFHAFCDRILRLEAIHIGLNPGYTLMTQAQSLLFLRSHLFEFKLEYFRPLGNPMKFLSGMLSHFSRLRDDDISPESYLTYAKKLESTDSLDEEKLKSMELAQAFKLYESLKVKEGVMDFSDLISNTLKLFRMRPNILKYYQNLFKYILVDEFQDTNYAQNELAIMLAGDKKNITVVGDDDQAIYRWRGAALANIIQFRTHFPKAKVITLTQNYRSTQQILDSAYKMVQNNNPDRLEVKEGIDKKLQSNRQTVSNENVEFIYAKRGEDEAEEVVKSIIADVKKNNRAYNEFAILVRANDHAMPFQRSLERARIPYQFLGPGHLFNQEEIKDLIAYLKCLANFDDNSSVYRILTMPIFAIAPRDVASLLNYAKKTNNSLFEAMEIVAQASLTPEGRQKIEKIVSMFKKHLEKVPHETAGQILFYFFEDSGLLGHYLDPRTMRTEKEAGNIAKFFTKLQSFSSNNANSSVFAVVEWIDMSMELGESPLSADIDWSENNAVNILTVHSSKGLEFPVVFVVNLVSQRFPTRDRKEQIPVPTDIIKEQLPTGDENLEEERRLFYVAMTRAKDKLFLTASKFYGDGKRERKLSTFILEALTDSYIQSVIQKQEDKQPTGQQLSLLEILNANVKPIDEKKEHGQKQDLPILTPITYISYSQLQTYLHCPLHYKLRYVMHMPPSDVAALSYGISVHNSLADFFRRISLGETSANDMHDILKKHWNPLGYQSRVHEKSSFAQADKMLYQVAERTLEKIPNTLAIELPFNFWLNKLKIGGRIDRIDRLKDGHIEIIDYKTGSNIPTQKQVDEDFQLTFYALAATSVRDGILNKNPDDIILTLYYLEANKKLSSTRSLIQLEEAKEKITQLVQEISTSNFRCSGGIFCRNCEYKMICQTFI